jgi:hypothetical protein
MIFPFLNKLGTVYYVLFLLYMMLIRCSLHCRHYFALQTNTGEQFYAFTSLCAWLIRKTGKRFEQHQEFDDPNATISKILDSLRSTVSIFSKCFTQEKV